MDYCFDLGLNSSNIRENCPISSLSSKRKTKTSESQNQFHGTHL